MDKEEIDKPYTRRIWLDGKGKQEEVMRFRAAKLDVVTRKLIISKYSLPKNYQIPKWNRREPLTVPEVEFWREE